jgi:hypothetical protein
MVLGRYLDVAGSRRRCGRPRDPAPIMEVGLAGEAGAGVNMEERQASPTLTSSEVLHGGLEDDAEVAGAQIEVVRPDTCPAAALPSQHHADPADTSKPGRHAVGRAAEEPGRARARWQRRQVVGWARL